MKTLVCVLLLASSCLLAQSNSGAMSQDKSKEGKGQVTVRGCIDRERGDYVLIQQEPGMTWQVQGTDKIHMSKYFGQRVEVTGKKVTSLESSSDAMTNASTPSPVTIMVSSVKVLDKSCAAHQVSH
jgi:hypothetical protein